MRWDSLKTFPVVEGRRRETGIAKTHELLFYRFSAAALESPSEAGFVCVCVPVCPLLRLFSLFGHKLIFIVDVGSLFCFDEREIFLRTVRPILDVNNDEPSSHMGEITILGYSELSPVFVFYFLYLFITWSELLFSASSSSYTRTTRLQSSTVKPPEKKDFLSGLNARPHHLPTRVAPSLSRVSSEDDQSNGNLI